MKRFSLFIDGEVQEGGEELLDAWRNEESSWLWIDLQDEDQAAEHALLVDQLALDPRAVAEAQRRRHPPSFEGFPGYDYLLLKPLTADSEDLEFETLQLAIFASPRLLVTRHSAYYRFIEKLHERIRSEPELRETPLAIAAAIARRVVKRYGTILLELEQRLDEIEDQLFESRGDQLMQELARYNTALRKMRRILAYHDNVFSSLSKRFGDAEDTYWRDEFDDIHGLMERFHSLADLYQNIISDLIDAYISLNGHHLNQIMKVLTIVTVIFVPLTLLVGIYGMNFEYIPELKSQNGYFVLLTVMGSIAAALLILFKRVRWL